MITFGDSWVMKAFLATFAVIAVLVGLWALGVGKQSAGPSEGRMTQFVSADIESVPNVTALALESRLVVRGIPVGVPHFRRSVPDGRLGDYYQSVRVKQVFKGAAPARIRVVRAGIGPRFVAAGSLVNEDLAGALPVGRSVFFLRRSAVPRLWIVVGHSQGVL